MALVITQPCEGVKDGACVDVCPADCIETTDASTQFFIDPQRCIDCDVCVTVCPVDAIYREDEVPDGWRSYITRNADFFAEGTS